MLLYLEYWLSKTFLNASGRGDCYFMLIPLCLFVFDILLCHRDIKIPHAKYLRKTSTLIYVMHYAVIICLEKFNSYLGAYAPTAIFFATTILVLVGSFLIIRLSNMARLKFLKFLY